MTVSYTISSDSVEEGEETGEDLGLLVATPAAPSSESEEAEGTEAEEEAAAATFEEAALEAEETAAEALLEGPLAVGAALLAAVSDLSRDFADSISEFSWDMAAVSSAAWVPEATVMRLADLVCWGAWVFWLLPSMLTTEYVEVG